MTCFAVKKCIHEKCATVSPIENILVKSLKMKFSLLKHPKITPKPGKPFTVWFPKELINREHLKNSPLLENYS